LLSADVNNEKGKFLNDQSPIVAASRHADADHDDALKLIGQRIKMARNARQMTQTELAVAVGVTRAAVSQWELAEVEVTLSRLNRIAAELKTDVAWLLSGAGPMPADAKDRAGLIPEMESSIGAGGPFHRQGLQTDFWRVPPHVLSGLKCRADSVRIFPVQTASMEPAVARGSYVLVDYSQTTVHDGQIYAIDNGVALTIKRLYLRGDFKRIELVSDAEPERKAVLDLRKVRIVGRLVAQFHAI
jgi:transcriptional regulator with XRE-family HTH domain